jgi:hypothetical protein
MDFVLSIITIFLVFLNCLFKQILLLSFYFAPVISFGLFAGLIPLLLRECRKLEETM